MMTPFHRTRIATAVAGVAFAFAAGQALGAGFALQENSGSALGNAFAGGAASGEDASTVWANPAGMSRIASGQVAAAVHLITPSMKFHNDNSVAAAQQPLGSDGGDAGSLNVVPNLYLVVPINQQWAFGLGVNAPFGLVTEYDADWIGRYQAIKSDVKTMNVNPAISFKVAPNFTIGVGANWQKLDATFTSAVNYSGALAVAAATAAAGGQIPAAVVPPFLAATKGLDARANIDGSDSSWGWNAGVLWDIDKNSRIGAHWRSGIKYNVSGSVNFSTPAAPALPAQLVPVYAALSNAVNQSPQLASGGVHADIEMPAIANISYFRAIDDRWDVMFDAQWTGWSSIEFLTFVRNNGVTLQSTPEHFKDVWRFAVGANYKLNDQWKLRGGLAYDQSPVRDEYRTPRLPDSDRTWLSAGAQWTLNKNLKFDVGGTYIFVKNGSIDDNAGSTASYGSINGGYKNNVIILSGQATYTF
jgi:long-chain fatty acid transport protein